MVNRLKGWAIFPIKENDKKPFPFLHNEHNQRGFYVASKNDEQIVLWEKLYPNCNWALRTGQESECWVLDIDVKNGARGDESFFDILADHKDFPETLTVKTPSGGMHYYFQYDNRSRTIVNTGKFGGIDTRSDGGYVLLPDSSLDGNKYEYNNYGTPIAKAPDWLINALFETKPLQKNNEGYERIKQDDNRAESLSVYLLSKYIPKAVKGNRNNTLMQLVCQLRDNLIPQFVAEERAREFVEAMNDKDFTVHEAISCVRSVYKRQARMPTFVDLDVTFNIKETTVIKNFDQPGIADYILYKHKNFIYIPEMSWAIYDEARGCWDTKNAIGRITDIVVEELRSLSKDENYQGFANLFKTNKKNVDDILSFIKNKVTKSYEDFNKTPYLINCKNGVINLRTLELLKHSPVFFFDYMLDVNYDPKADMTLWNRFLRDSLENADKNEGGIYQLELLQLSAGYSMTGETCEECLFYVYGKTRSGKSTFINTINDILGPLASTIHMNSLMQKKVVTDTQNFELASLFNKHFVVSSETDRDTYLDSAKIKNLTGRDTIKCSFKYKDPFQAKVKFKIWLTSNNEILIDGSDDAAWGRFRTFCFPYSKINNPNINLKEDLMKTKDGIFLWLCVGAYFWYMLKDRGERLPVPQSMKNYLKERQGELDAIGEFINYRRWAPAPKEATNKIFVTIQDLYNQYTSWCSLNGIEKKYSKMSMASIISQKGFEKDTQRVGDRTARGVWVQELYNIE